MKPSILPQVPWQAESYWSLKPYPLIVSSLALFMYGIGDGLILQSHLGNTPWTIFSQGISLHTSFSIGMANFITSLFILLLWIPLRVRLGLNTILNSILISLAIDVARNMIPIADVFWMQVSYVLLGIVITGVSSAYYICANMGTGPRDGVMVAISARFGFKIAWVRTSLELFACITGWLMGGVLGIGTILFALSIGPILSWTMNRWNRYYPSEWSQYHQ